MGTTPQVGQRGALPDGRTAAAAAALAALASSPSVPLEPRLQVITPACNQGLADVARLVIQRTFNPRDLTETAPDGVASNLCQVLLLVEAPPPPPAPPLPPPLPLITFTAMFLAMNEIPPPHAPQLSRTARSRTNGARST